MQLKEQKKKLKEAEKRAILAERTVKKLLKEVDMKEGKQKYDYLRVKLSHGIFFQRDYCLSDELREEKEKYRAVCDDMDITFAEMTGY